MSTAFTSAFVSWAGISTPGMDDASLAELNAFYDRVHIPEILRNNPGFLRASRYKLLFSDPRALPGPGWLTMYDVQDKAAAQAHIAQTQLPREQRPPQTPGPPAWNAAERQWRLLWRRLVSIPSEPAAAPPHAIYLVGMNVPADGSAADRAAFDSFYTDVHLPEVLASGGYTRATRYELFHPFETPPAATARYLAVYEADETATRRLLERAETAAAPSGALSAGPPVWEQHQTLWRLLYQRLK